MAVPGNYEYSESALKALMIEQNVEMECKLADAAIAILSSNCAVELKVQAEKYLMDKLRVSQEPYPQIPGS